MIHDGVKDHANFSVVALFDQELQVDRFSYVPIGREKELSSISPVQRVVQVLQAKQPIALMSSVCS